MLRDLLVSQDKPIDIREDPEQGIVIVGVSEVVTTSRKEIITMIKYFFLFDLIELATETGPKTPRARTKRPRVLMRS